MKHCVLAAALMLLPALAFGGTLCGTVTENGSGAPIAHAGVFLRTPAGAYTGLYGASDETGSFCIADVPAGTYDVEVRVNDEQVAYLRDVVVSATTDVGIVVPDAVRFAAPSPNPARLATVFRWTLPTAAPVRLRVLDASGRALRTWADARSVAGDHSLSWNLRDSSGRLLPPGTYFAQLDAGGLRRRQSIVIVR